MKITNATTAATHMNVRTRIVEIAARQFHAEVTSHSLAISHDASLPVTRAGHVIVLGHVLRPDAPHADNAHIAQRLASCSSFECLEQQLAGLSGRWLVIAEIGSERRLYPDAAGSKSVFYARGQFASHPALMGCAADESLAAYPNAATWPVGLTPYAGVRQLLPNHYLDLSTFQPVRFGPRATPMELDQAVEVIRRHLRGTLDAIVQRGVTALPVTAGYDSRTLVSAAAGLPVRYFTVIDERTPHHDLAVPKAIAERLNLSWRYVESVAGKKETLGGIWQDPNSDRLGSFAQAPFVVLGHVSEICRCFYWPSGTRRVARAEDFAEQARLSGCPAILPAIRDWLVSLPEGIDPWDMWYWENRAGGWSSLCCTALDQWCDVISPWNCRAILEAGLGLDVAHRRRPYELHRRLCLPEIRELPYNSTWVERSPLPWRAREFMRGRLYRAAQGLARASC